MSSHLIWAVTALLALPVACTPRSRHEDTRAGETRPTGAEPPGVPTAELPGWTKVQADPLAARDVVRPTPEERAAAKETAGPPLVQAHAETPLPGWVPESGRLTIVEARDLARNLGLEGVTSSTWATRR